MSLNQERQINKIKYIFTEQNSYGTRDFSDKGERYLFSPQFIARFMFDSPELMQNLLSGTPCTQMGNGSIIY